MIKYLVFIFVAGVLMFEPALLHAGTVFPREDGHLRLLTYNIRNCVGMDDITDYQRVADVINRLSPDVAAIQETDSATRRSKGLFVMGELAERTQMHCTFAPAINFQGGKYGTGILSREKPVSVRQIPLPGEEERILLIAEFEHYVVCCTHLALEAENRKLSIQIILDAVKDVKKTLFLAGDLNATDGSPELAALSERFSMLNDPQKATFPADKPAECIDYIYGDNGGGYSVLECQVVNEPVASDHRPLYVDVRLLSGAFKRRFDDPN